MKKTLFAFGLITTSLYFSGCNSKADIKREQELERIKSEVNASRTDKADLAATLDEMRQDIAKIHSSLEEQAQARMRDSEETKKELMTLTARVQAMEQRVVAEETQKREVKSKASYESAKRLFDDKKFDEAVEVAKEVLHANPKGEEAKKTQFLLAESYYGSQDYASAALEFGEFKKQFPKDNLVPEATYQMAQAFKQMGKKSEAKLFLQEVIEKHPKSQFASRAKSDLKKIK